MFMSTRLSLVIAFGWNSDSSLESSFNIVLSIKSDPSLKTSQI